MKFDRALFMRSLFCLILLVCAPLMSHAQTQQSRENQEWERRERERLRQERDFERRADALRNLGNRGTNRGSNASLGAPRYPAYRTPKLTDEQKSLLKPSPVDEAAYARFLNQPDTGLIRLLPREKYDQTIQMPLRGGGAYYSFTKLSQEYGPWSDIRFQDGKFQTAVNKLTYGFMAALGDVPLESIGADSAMVKLIGGLPVPIRYGELMSEEAKKNMAGFEVGGKMFRSSVQAQPGTTYLLRSVIYNYSDSIIVFRAVRKDDDGAATLLWKRLSKLPPKKLKDVPIEDAWNY